MEDYRIYKTDRKNEKVKNMTEYEGRGEEMKKEATDRDKKKTNIGKNVKEMRKS